MGAAVFLAASAAAGAARAANYLDDARPSIWTDPDGCQHYAVYNGWQGFMAPRFRADGTMDCAARPCLVASADQLFATGSAAIGPEGRRRLREFFRQDRSSSYVIHGHTDNVGAYGYNMRLSVRRASAVAAIARGAGATVSSIEGLGYTEPRASNATAEGRAENRRVEVMCER